MPASSAPAFASVASVAARLLVGDGAAGELFAQVAIWSACVAACRAVFPRPSGDAASLVSLTYCGATVAWAGVAVAAEVPSWPSNAFDFELGEHPWGAAFGIRWYLLFSVAYFSTDLVFDYDPRFVTHHVLSLAAMLTTWLVPGLQGSFAMTAGIAEIGGVAYHVSKLVRRDAVTWAYLWTYAGTRLVLFPALMLWLVVSLGVAHPLFLVRLWATSGTGVLVAINVKWCMKSWARFDRQLLERRAAAAAAELKNVCERAQSPPPCAATRDCDSAPCCGPKSPRPTVRVPASARAHFARPGESDAAAVGLVKAVANAA